MPVYIGKMQRNDIIRLKSQEERPLQKHEKQRKAIH